MYKPTAAEIHTATRLAEIMMNSGNDPRHLGATLVELNRQNEMLEEVLNAAVHYMHSQSERDHARLSIAIDRARGVKTTQKEQMGLA